MYKYFIKTSSLILDACSERQVNSVSMSKLSEEESEERLLAVDRLDIGE